jgi:hypothetical protein
MTTAMRRRSPRAASTWLMAGLLSVLFAACAQGAGPGVATNTASLDPEDAGLLYAQCMRDNGVPDFPDPNADGRFALDHDEFDRDDPTFQAASEECRDLAPGGEHQNTGDPATVEQMREFSQCMRDNGLPDFPDPDADGRLRGIGHEAGGPTYDAAMEACREKLPGGGDH